jgi:hypothetical protein
VIVNKTTVYLEEGSLASLKRLAAAQGRAEAELIREAVTEYVARAGRPPMRSLGVAHGPTDLASRDEELLSEGFGKARRRRARR